MFKPQMIENQKIFKSFCEHQEAVCMVVLDSSLDQNSRLLCSQCLVNFDSEKKIIGIDKVIQKIEEIQKEKMVKVESLLQKDIELVKQLHQNLINLQTFTNQKLQNLIENSLQWIQTQQSLVSKYQSYSFFNELEKLIKNENSFQIFEKNLIQDIGVHYESQYEKINQNLQWFQQFEQYEQCQEILKKISCNYQFQIIKQVPKVEQQIEKNLLLSYQIPDNKKINKLINKLKIKYEQLLPQLQPLLNKQKELLINQQQLQYYNQQLLLNQQPLLNNQRQLQKHRRELSDIVSEIRQQLPNQQEINDQLWDVAIEINEVLSLEHELKENQIILLKNQPNLQDNQKELLENQSNLLLSYLKGGLANNKQLKKIIKSQTEVNCYVKDVINVFQRVMVNQLYLQDEYHKLNENQIEILQNQDKLRDNQKELLKNYLKLHVKVIENYLEVFKDIEKLLLLILKSGQIET